MGLAVCIAVDRLVGAAAKAGIGFSLHSDNPAAGLPLNPLRHVQTAVTRRCVADGSIIGAGASVGPFSFLRPGTDLGADGKIGTFVETKNAKIGAGSKVPHLSYVGDAEIGIKSNIGAGTIFANYDGINKHRSKIGSHVRTGSDNVFVAPIEIGDGAYTAAGTIVRRDVAPGELAMNVAPQRNLADWVIQKREGSAAANAALEAKAAGATDKTSTEN